MQRLTNTMKKALGETQTLRTGHINEKPKIFAPPQTPYLHLKTQFGENRCTHFRVIVVTDPHTNNAHPPVPSPVANTQTGQITIHCAAKLSAQCNQYSHTEKETKKKNNAILHRHHTYLYRHRIMYGFLRS